MVKLTKRPLPPIKSRRDFDKPDVFDILAEDCHGKCYICEDKPTSIDVEHIVPHKSDPALEFDGDNLFIACRHCNKVKHTKYDDILNPTQCDPEKHISLTFTADIKNQVYVEALLTDNSTLQTVELLNKVYNDESTSRRKLECTNFRNEHIAPILYRFELYLHSYRNEPNPDYKELICEEIARSSIFAAFKRKIVQDDPVLKEVFASSLA